MTQRQSTSWAEDGRATIVYLYLSCVGAKNAVQSLLRDNLFEFSVAVGMDTFI